MKVTALKAQVKNADRVSVFVDGKYSFSLTLDQLLLEKLKKDHEIDEVRIKQLKKLSDEGKLKARAMEWLMGRPHSEREFRDYMFRKKADKDLIESWTEEFKDKKLINDYQFGLWFAENRLRKNKSKREIEAELRYKGVSPVTIQNIVTELNLLENEKEALKELVSKLRKRARYSDEIKLKRYLTSKGFKYSDIKEVLEP